MTHQTIKTLSKFSKKNSQQITADGNKQNTEAENITKQFILQAGAELLGSALLKFS